MTVPTDTRPIKPSGEGFETVTRSEARSADFFGARWSLKHRLQALGVLAGLTLAAVALLGFHLSRNTESAHVADASTQMNLALERMTRQYENGVRTSDGASAAPPPLVKNHDALYAISLESLADLPGLEGGFYDHAEGRLIGYAYPTYLGSGPKTDIPEAERPTITRLVGQAIVKKNRASEHIERGFDVILFGAVPLLQNERAVGAIWVMHRLPGVRNPQGRYNIIGLIIILTMAGLIAGGAWLIARHLDRAITQMVDGIRALHANTPLIMTSTGYAELNRVVVAINHLVETIRQQQHNRDLLERQLQQADRLAILGRLVAGVAHEVRNPLSSIRLKLQLARRGPIEMHKFIGTFDVVEKEISRLDRLVARLLSIAKPVSTSVTETDWAQFVETRLQHWRARASEFNVMVTHDVTANDNGYFTVSIDQDRLGQILDNLVANSFDAVAGTGGSIRVGVTVQDDGICRLTVTDTGPGISPETQAHLFEPFFTTRPQGTGLGLFLSAEMARALGGTLVYVNSPHGGTCFELRIPHCPLQNRRNAHAIDSPSPREELYETESRT